MPLTEIIARQHAWAQKRWPGHVGARAPSVNENLFAELPAAVQRSFKDANGGELDRSDSPGKMRSLRSSSALGVNFFAPWLGQDLAPLARALGVTLTDSSIVFERKFKHGLPSIPPNVDIVLDNQQARKLGIESKFTEPYGPRPRHPAIAAKYFKGDRRRWEELGLPRCQQLARRLGDSETFHRLGAGQLLKHILGLAHETGQPPRLVVLWYDNGCEEARVHGEELGRFASLIDGAIEFSSRTYQTAIASLRVEDEPVPGYLTYLKSRYLSDQS